MQRLIMAGVRRFLAPTILSAATPWKDSEFDISRFESSQPSQSQGSLSWDFGHSEKSRHFRRLAAKSPVSGEECRKPPTEGRDFRGKSLLVNDRLKLPENRRFEIAMTVYPARSFECPRRS